MKPSKKALQKALQTLPFNDLLYGDTSRPLSEEELLKALEAAYEVDLRGETKLIPPTPTQDSIRCQKEEIAAQIATAQEHLEMMQFRLQQLQKRCKHPNAKNYTTMCEPCMICPDCGYNC